MEEGKVGEVEAKAVLRRNILRDTNYLISKGLLTGNEVYYLIKSFLKDYLNLKYEFTKDELFLELKNIYIPFSIRADFFKFIEKVFMFEYSQVIYSEDELRSFLNEFKNFLDYLLVPTTIEKSARVGSIIFRNWRKKLSKKREKVNVVDVQSAVLLPLENLDPKKAGHVEINSLLEKIYYSLYNSDVDSAVELYKQVLQEYSALSDDEKMAYYETLNSVYQSIENS
ncbi:MAG: hypothetical protein ABIB43_02825 [archaeon]